MCMVGPGSAARVDRMKVHSAITYQRLGMRSGLGSQENHHFFIRSSFKAHWAWSNELKKLQFDRLEKKLWRGQSWSTIVYCQMRKSLICTKSCQNSILKAPIAWTYPRVDQIWSQIKKWVSEKNGDFQVGFFQAALSSGGLDVKVVGWKAALAQPTMVWQIFEKNQLFVLRPDLPHFKGCPEDWRSWNQNLRTFFWWGWICI